jgi:hypothetical protein
LRFIDLTPCVPLSWKERGRICFEEVSPFKLPTMNDYGKGGEK